ncbi:MAG: hypothetical protein KGZ79_09230 [Dethiobacter sp.]|jgi:predicted  nucleic acid-binding Zn-ribbon protein|nr:hypothetical protein [Dethiobacter sp.]
MGELATLYDLQQLELELDRLKKTLKELPVYSEFKKLQSEVADAKEAIGWTETKLNEQRKRIKRMEMDAEKVQQESKEVQAKLYSGAVRSSKELEQLESKGKALLREKDKAEETLLLAMEAYEELETAITTAKNNHNAINQKLRELQQQGNKEIKGLKDRIQHCQAARDQLREQIGSVLLESYGEMRPRFHGRPLARVVAGICGGCRVSISSNLTNRLCNPEAVVTCENCGRMLVPS